ncbi:MAG: PAS sensor histidine kinase, partial [halophilic archaeon J07HX5]
MYVTDFVPTDEIETIATSFQRVLETGESVTVESAFETKAGERIPFEFTGAPLADANGEVRGLTGIGRNISARKKRQRQFEAVFNNTYQFTGLMAPDGTILEANKTALEFGGLDRDQLVGNKLWETYFFQISEQARAAAQEAVNQASTGEFFRDQLRVQGADRAAVIDFSVRPVTD